MSGNRFENTYFSIMGDSISTYEGYLPAGNEVYYSGRVRYYTGVYGVAETWWKQVIDGCGAKLLVNNSWSGSYVCKAPGTEIESYGCSDSRAYGLDAEGIMPDHILVFIGTNDRGAGYPLTSEDKTDLGVIENAYREMLRKMKKKYPLAEIWCLTFPAATCKRDIHYRFREAWNGVLTEEYGRIVKQVAQTAECHAIVLEDVPCDTNDGLHPNFEGMTSIAQRVIATMQSR